MSHSRTLRQLPGRYAIHRLDPHAAVPADVLAGPSQFTSVTRTGQELSIIGPARDEPRAETWECLRIEGPFGLDEPGVLASVVAPLAAAGLSVFAVATHDTDHLLVRDATEATAVLRRAGHRVHAAAQLPEPA